MQKSRRRYIVCVPLVLCALVGLACGSDAGSSPGSTEPAAEAGRVDGDSFSRLRLSTQETPAGFEAAVQQLETNEQYIARVVTLGARATDGSRPDAVGWGAIIDVAGRQRGYRQFFTRPAGHMELITTEYRSEQHARAALTQPIGSDDRWTWQPVPGETLGALTEGYRLEPRRNGAKTGYAIVWQSGLYVSRVLVEGERADELAPVVARALQRRLAS